MLANTSELDTFLLAQVFAPINLASLSLSTLAEYYDIVHTDAHRAWSDAAASLDLLSHFAREIDAIPDILWLWYSYVIARIDQRDPFRVFIESHRTLDLSSYDRIRESILVLRESVVSS